MEGTEVRKLAELEDRHWWYRERRHLAGARDPRLAPGRRWTSVPPAVATPACCATSGGARPRWSTAPRAPRVAAERGIPVLRGDATRLPVRADAASTSSSPSTSWSTSRTTRRRQAESSSCCAPAGGSWSRSRATMRLWSAHDEAVGHVRRYARDELVALAAPARGSCVGRRAVSWNVLLRPVVALRRRSSTGSDLDELAPLAQRRPARGHHGRALPAGRPAARRVAAGQRPAALIGRPGRHHSAVRPARSARPRESRATKYDGRPCICVYSRPTYSPSSPRHSSWTAPTAATTTNVEVQPGTVACR